MEPTDEEVPHVAIHDASKSIANANGHRWPHVHVCRSSMTRKREIFLMAGHAIWNCAIKSAAFIPFWRMHDLHSTANFQGTPYKIRS